MIELVRTDPIESTCTGAQRYDLKFWSWWNSADFQSYDKSFWSRLVLVTHDGSLPSMFYPGTTNATEGIETLAVERMMTNLTAEISAQNQSTWNLYSSNYFFTPESLAEDMSLSFEVFENASYVTMFVPLDSSPDWFAAIPSMNLCDDVTGEWRDGVEEDVFLYTAGIRSGLNFTEGEEYEKH